MKSNPTGSYRNAFAVGWWMLIIRGVAAILFGALTIAVPAIGLHVLIILWGTYAMVDGVFALMHAVRRSRAGLPWGWWLLEGIVGIGAGVLTFMWPAITALVLLSVIAVWAVLTGIAEIAASVLLRRQIRGEWLLAISGVLSIVFGILLLGYPGPGVLALVWLIGAYAILFGVFLISLGWRLKRWPTVGDRLPPIATAPSTA